MSKQDILLNLIGCYVDGLSQRNIHEKLPNNWFSTLMPAKEVQNALQNLKRKGLAELVEITDLDGVWHWKRVEQPPAPGAAIQTADQGSEPVDASAMDGVTGGAAERTADAGSGADASAPALDIEVEDIHYADPPTDHGVEGMPVPEGISMVQMWRTSDGITHDSLEDAVRHELRRKLELEIADFVGELPQGLPPSELLMLWESRRRA